MRHYTGNGRPSAHLDPYCVPEPPPCLGLPSHADNRQLHLLPLARRRWCSATPRSQLLHPGGARAAQTNQVNNMLSCSSATHESIQHRNEERVVQLQPWETKSVLRTNAVRSQSHQRRTCSPFIALQADRCYPDSTALICKLQHANPCSL